MSNQEKDISHSVLEKIKEEKIMPTPRWEFLAKNYFVWTLGALALVLGGLAVSVIIYMLLNNDWEIYDSLADNLFEFILLTLPYFWLIILVLFVWLINLNIKHTKDGYKYNIRIIALASVLASIFLGGLLYAAGIGNALDDVLAENAPFYRPIINRQFGMWAQPDKGLLIGLVATTSGEEFGLFDLDGKAWDVDFERASNSPLVRIVSGEHVKLIGQKIGDNQFEAFRIFPIGPGKSCFNNQLVGGCGMLPPDDNQIHFFMHSPVPLENTDR